MDELRNQMKLELTEEEININRILAQNNMRFEGSGPDESQIRSNSLGNRHEVDEDEEDPYNTLGFGF